MDPIDMDKAAVEEYVAKYGLDDDMYFSLHSTARERIAALEAELNEKR